jgi:Methyltransferase domain
MLSIVYDGKLYLAPIGENPGRCLDIGAGSGIWCIEMGEKFPSADITGIDLSANFPTWVPPNVHFEVEDVEEPWTFTRPFDYIHCRYMAGAISDWPGLMRQCFEQVIIYDSITRHIAYLTFQKHKPRRMGRIWRFQYRLLFSRRLSVRRRSFTALAEPI